MTKKSNKWDAIRSYLASEWKEAMWKMGGEKQIEATKAYCQGDASM